MPGEIEDTRFRNRAIVHLDLVCLRKRHRRENVHGAQYQDKRAQNFLKKFHWRSRQADSIYPAVCGCQILESFYQYWRHLSPKKKQLPRGMSSLP